MTRSASRAASLHSLSDASSDSFNHSPGEPTKDAAAREHFLIQQPSDGGPIEQRSRRCIFQFFPSLFSAARMAKTILFVTDISYLCEAKQGLALLELLLIVQH